VYIAENNQALDKHPHQKKKKRTPEENKTKHTKEKTKQTPQNQNAPTMQCVKKVAGKKGVKKGWDRGSQKRTTTFSGGGGEKSWIRFPCV